MKKKNCFGILIAALALAVACEKPKPNPVENVELLVPDYSGSKDFSLSGASGSRSFFGQMLIWDAGVTSAQVSEVLTLKRKANEAMVARVRSLDAYMSSVLGPASRNLDALIANKQRVEAEAAPRIREQSWSSASSWFEQELAKSLTSDVPAVAQNARNVFDAYCEAKLFAFGTSAALSGYRYTSRPTPLAVCESVYRERGFFTDASCDSSGAPKSYFECIWKQGVLKTRIASRYAPEQKLAIETLISNAQFQRIFTGSVDAGCSMIKVRGTNRIRTSASSDLISNHILNGAKSQEFTCNGVQGSFSLADAPVGSPTLEQASPAKISGDLESRAVNCATMICFAPPQLADGSVVSEAAQNFGAKISLNLMAFGAQSLSCGTERAAWWTKNFAVFNAPIMVGLPSQATCNEPNVSDYPAVIAVDSDLENAKAAVQGALTDFSVKKMQACLTFDTSCDPTSVNNVLSENERAAASAASAAALQKGIAISVVPSFSINTRTENGVDVVVVNIESTTVRESWAICLSQGIPTECGPVVLSQNQKLLRFAAFDRDTGILSFEVDIDDARIFGHQEYGVHDLVQRDFPGSVLRVELLPALMGGFLPYLSGTVSVLKNGVRVYQGVSYGVDTALSRAHERIFYSH